MKSTITYLVFDGNCKAAMEFYKGCFGADLFTMPFSDAPCVAGAAQASPDRLVHATLGKGSPMLMAADILPGMPFQQGNNFSVNVECESLSEEQALFAALGEGGKVTTPLQDTFWSAHFGMLTDRFGINWMFNFMLPKQG